MELILLLGTDKSVELRFKILDNPIADLWQQRMNLRHAWPLDDPNRFYGFRSKQDELNLAITDALNYLDNYCSDFFFKSSIIYC